MNVKTVKTSVLTRLFVVVGMLAALLVCVVSTATTASAGSDTYPSKWRDVAQDSMFDDWGEYNRECTSYVAWMLHSVNGYEMPFHSDASGWKAYAQARGITVDTTPAVGAVGWKMTSSTVGHVVWVESVNSGSTVTVEDYNSDFTGHYGEHTVATNTYQYIHFKDLGTLGGGTGRSDATSSPMAFRGHWQRGTGDGVAYITPNTDGGFTVAVLSPGLVWQGAWLTVPATSGATFTHTRFIAADQDGDGLTDLFYVVSGDPTAPGWVIGLLHNTGSGFVYDPSVTTSTQYVSLDQTVFIPGHFQAGTGDGLAYAIPSTDGGFSVSVLSPGLVWQGSWEEAPGSSGANFNSVKFIPADQDGDGLTDLFYAISSSPGNPSAMGWVIGLLHNTGSSFTFSASVTASTPSVSLAQTVFMPGHFQAGTGDGLAYVTPNTDGGFTVAVLSPNLAWQGAWEVASSSSGATFSGTKFAPADQDGDGLTDLFYAVSGDPSAPGWAIGLFRNTGSNFSWVSGVSTSAPVILNQTVFQG